MSENAAESFCDHFGIRPGGASRDLLAKLGHAFSRLPYENLTKLIKKHRLPPGPERRRQPAEVLADHLAHGTGGTCFALTELFVAVLQRFGFACHRAFCDTRQRLDAHCALVVHLDRGPHLIDPGYLLHEPLPLIEGVVGAAAGSARLVAIDGAATTFDLYTYGAWRYRLKLAPAAAGRYLAVWDDSFEWPMMKGIHLCAPAAEGYAYVHNHTLCLRGSGARENVNIRGQETAALAHRFAIDPVVVAEAYRVLSESRAVGVGFPASRYEGDGCG